MVVLGTSQKSLIKDTDPMYEMIKGINGLSVKITEGKKTLVDMQADKGNQSIEKEFTY
jgi:hypothetical protein